MSPVPGTAELSQSGSQQYIVACSLSSSCLMAGASTSLTAHPRGTAVRWWSSSCSRGPETCPSGPLSSAWACRPLQITAYSPQLTSESILGFGQLSATTDRCHSPAFSSDCSCCLSAWTRAGDCLDPSAQSYLFFFNLTQGYVH